jgi:hypothetical protein
VVGWLIFWDAAVWLGHLLGCSCVVGSSEDTAPYPRRLETQNLKTAVVYKYTKLYVQGGTLGLHCSSQPYENGLEEGFSNLTEV